MFRLLLGCFLLFIFCAVSVNAQKEAKTFNVSPELYAYYQY